MFVTLYIQFNKKQLKNGTAVTDLKYRQNYNITYEIIATVNGFHFSLHTACFWGSGNWQNCLFWKVCQIQTFGSSLAYEANSKM